MSSNSVLHAAGQESPNNLDLATMITVFPVKCSAHNAPIVAKILKYPLNPVPVDECTAANATVKSGQVDNFDITINLFKE